MLHIHSSVDVCWSSVWRHIASAIACTYTRANTAHIRYSAFWLCVCLSSIISLFFLFLIIRIQFLPSSLRGRHFFFVLCIVFSVSFCGDHGMLFIVSSDLSELAMLICLQHFVFLFLFYSQFVRVSVSRFSMNAKTFKSFKIFFDTRHERTSRNPKKQEMNSQEKIKPFLFPVSRNSVRMSLDSYSYRINGRHFYVAWFKYRR